MTSKYSASPLGSKFKCARSVMWLIKKLKVLDKFHAEISAVAVSPINQLARDIKATNPPSSLEASVSTHLCYAPILGGPEGTQMAHEADTNDRLFQASTSYMISNAIHPPRRTVSKTSPVLVSSNSSDKRPSNLSLGFQKAVKVESFTAVQYKV